MANLFGLNLNPSNLFSNLSESFVNPIIYTQKAINPIIYWVYLQIKTNDRNPTTYILYIKENTWVNNTTTPCKISKCHQGFTRRPARPSDPKLANIANQSRVFGKKMTNLPVREQSVTANHNFKEYLEFLLHATPQRTKRAANMQSWLAIKCTKINSNHY